MKKNVITNNYYGILGVLPFCSSRQITKNAKEISKYLQINEIPKYKFDFDFYNKNRTEQNVKEAVSSIINPKINILHSFFRIFVADEEDSEYLLEIEQNCNISSIKLCSDFNKKRNVAILLLILLFDNKFVQFSKYVQLLENSLFLWSDIIKNDTYLKDFIENYKLHSEIDFSNEIYKNFEQMILEELAYIYSDLSVFYDTPIFLHDFINNFGTKCVSIKIEPIEKIYHDINEDLKKINSMKISEDGVFDDEERQTINLFINKTRKNLKKLKDYGFYDNSKTIILRDTISKSIRMQSVDLFNNLSNIEDAINLLNFCIDVAATENLKIELKKDKEQLKKQKEISKAKKHYDKILYYVKRIMESSNYTVNNFYTDINNIKSEFTMLKNLNLYTIEETKNIRIFTCNVLLELAKGNKDNGEVVIKILETVKDITPIAKDRNDISDMLINYKHATSYSSRNSYSSSYNSNSYSGRSSSRSSYESSSNPNGCLIPIVIFVSTLFSMFLII